MYAPADTSFPALPAVAGDSQVNVIAAKAITKLQESDLQLTPENFAVYYHYFYGDVGNLKMAMDILFEKSINITQAQCSELFLSYLSLESETEVMTTSTKTVDQEIRQVMETLEKIGGNTQEYKQALDTFSGSLGDVPNMSVDTIRVAVQRLARETKIMADQNQRLHDKLLQSTEQLTEVRYNLDLARTESQSDSLTGIGNRKFFNTELEHKISDAVSMGTPLCLLMVDIDKFRKFNDKYGYLLGDQVLRLVARTMVEGLKGRDVICRYGGEEFTVLLTETNLANAEKVSNQLRTGLGNKQLRRRDSKESFGVVTVSIGVAEYIANETGEHLVARADAAMHKAKAAGRNCVILNNGEE